MRTHAPSRLFYSGPAIAAVLAALALLGLWLLSQARSGTEAVRLRNALLFQVGAPTDFDWTPERRPAGFATDATVPAQPFAAVVEQLGLAGAGSDWERGRLIAAHLVAAAKSGNAARDDLAGTYRKILGGEGYCADFTTTFIAIARAAGLFAREWAFSFDGFGGHGHALVELWDRQQQRWMLLDVFNNWAPLDAASGEPMSAAAFRERLRAGQQQSVKISRLGPGRFGFRDEATLWSYYGAGADQWYLWWGNAVYAYDGSLVNRMFSPLSRTLEQLAAVAVGTHPGVMAIATASNEPMRARMLRLRSQLLVGLGAGLLLSVLLVLQLLNRWRSRHA